MSEVTSNQDMEETLMSQIIRASSRRNYNKQSSASLALVEDSRQGTPIHLRWMVHRLQELDFQSECTALTRSQVRLNHLNSHLIKVEATF